MEASGGAGAHTEPSPQSSRFRYPYGPSAPTSVVSCLISPNIDHRCSSRGSPPKLDAGQGCQAVLTVTYLENLLNTRVQRKQGTLNYYFAKIGRIGEGTDPEPWKFSKIRRRSRERHLCRACLFSETDKGPGRRAPYRNRLQAKFLTDLPGVIVGWRDLSTISLQMIPKRPFLN